MSAGFAVVGVELCQGARLSSGLPATAGFAVGGMIQALRKGLSL